MYDKLIYNNYYTKDYINEYFNVNFEELLYLYDYTLTTKSASDVDVTRYNELDDSEVFKVLPPSVDLSGAHVTIDTEHWFIHKGLHFFDGRVLEIPANQTYNWVVETGAKAPHMTFEVSPTNGGVFITTYRNVTADENGTLYIPQNNNELSTNASTVKFRLNPTNIVPGSFIRGARIGTVGGTAQRTGGNLSRTNEVILNKNKKYLLTIQNLNNDICYVNINHSFYENGL